MNDDQKLSIARSRGYVDDEQAAIFASCLTGDTAEELAASADRITGLLAELTPSPRPAHPRGFDPSQARGLESPSYDPNQEFADWINSTAFRR